MTKTRITFPAIAGTNIRRNAETGVEIRSNDTGYTIWRADREGTLSYWGTERGLKNARELATERVETIREEVAEAHAEALAMDATETARVSVEVTRAVTEVRDAAQAHPASRVVQALLFGAKYSARGGIVQVGRDRLARARAILDGTTTVPTDADAAQELAAETARLPQGTRVRLSTGQRAGLTGRIYGEPKVYAEHNRCSVMVKIDGKGYTSEWCDSLTTI